MAARELGIKLQAPSGDITAQDQFGLSRDIPLEAGQKTQLQQIQGQATQFVLQQFQQAGFFNNIEGLTDLQKEILKEEITTQISALEGQLRSGARQSLGGPR